ncbi:MAG TPA: hypothetical protein VFW19_02435 [Allosphingosinicella sp.]|nr:hypothetical protein [Allosphingosinicella sp.]
MIWKAHRAALAIACAVLAAATARAEAPPPLTPAAAADIFRQARELCGADRGRLWGRSLCGPIMLVDPRDRRIVANQRDAGGILRPEGGVFTGRLPASENISNTATPWSGTFWTEIAWPLPSDPRARGLLIAHELFHRIQPRLGLPTLRGGDNRHLDTLEGRTLLQLEWRALAAALKASDAAGRTRALADALLFRAERYRLFPSAAAEEEALELNEGLAEYTGVRAGVATGPDRTRAALADLAAHRGDDSFVRSFAYATGPAYGLLLDRYAPGWRLRIAKQPRFDLLLAGAARLRVPAPSAEIVAARAAAYGGPALRAAEAKRDARRRVALACYRAKFVEGPVVAIALTHMNIQFDPRNLQPLDDRGTIYPNARITDDWGVLETENGALLSPKWDEVTLGGPATAEGGTIKGDGWTIALKPGWSAAPGPRPGDLVLKGPAG